MSSLVCRRCGPQALQEALFPLPHRLVLYLHDSSNSRSYKAFAPLPRSEPGPSRERRKSESDKSQT